MFKDFMNSDYGRLLVMIDKRCFGSESGHELEVEER